MISCREYSPLTGGGKISDLLENRQWLMGVSITSICLLHALSQANITLFPVVLLNFGVDVFLL